MLGENLKLQHALCIATKQEKNPVSGLYEIVSTHRGENLITSPGLIVIHGQIYGTSGLLTNGFNYIGLSTDTLSETTASTTLSTEFSSGGLSRAQGAVALPTGSGNQTTVTHTFVATATNSVNKTALFTAVSSGTMQHVLQFDSTISLVSTNQLIVVFTLTVG